MQLDAGHPAFLQLQDDAVEGAVLAVGDVGGVSAPARRWAPARTSVPPGVSSSRRTPSSSVSRSETGCGTCALQRTRESAFRYSRPHRALSPEPVAATSS
ncbi:hypothetical protein GCM10023323_63420 [Streptomyces thinghirensis]|uniref:Uncharacterized protein n=1 Tax=Streptomyces thinghirensis TaxID=551547 RepID=A0ABP9TGA7_9ACTN